MTHAELPRPRLVQIGRRRWRLAAPYIYGPFYIPGGFETDGASSLGFFVTSWGGHYPVAVLVHDYLYHRLNEGRPHPAAPTRRAADRVFRDILRQSGVAPLVRFGMFVAVRVFGGRMTRRFFVRR